MNSNAMKEYNDKALDACPNCARTFLPDRLLVHLKSCKGNGVGSKPPPSKIMAGGQGSGNAASLS